MTSAGLCVHSSEVLAQPSLMPRYSSPASTGAERVVLYKVRDCVLGGVQLLYIFSKSSFDFFQIGHTVIELAELVELEVSESPM